MSWLVYSHSMKLIEAEAKQLLQQAGIEVPPVILLKQGDAIPADLPWPVMVKAQTLCGGRGKTGLVKEAADADEAKQVVAQLWLQSTAYQHAFDTVLIEPKVSVLHEYYVSVTYDTNLRAPVFVVSPFGGMDIEVVSKRQPKSIRTLPIDPLRGVSSVDWPKEWQWFSSLAAALYECFVKNDADLVEINPLAKVSRDGKDVFVALDAKISLDDTALFRHDFPFPVRTGFRELTDMEKRARAIDAESHRGVAGRTFLQLDGDIAFMSSGGGASITCLDALIAYGGKPANFVEYSGNPEREKVHKLARLVLSRQGLRGLWIVGPTANFTDVYETLGGIMDALIEVKPSYPIVIRRAGPRDAEAKDMVLRLAAKHALDIMFFGEEMPMTESAKVLMDKIKHVKTSN